MERRKEEWKRYDSQGKEQKLDWYCVFDSPVDARLSQEVFFFFFLNWTHGLVLIQRSQEGCRAFWVGAVALKVQLLDTAGSFGL